MLQITFPILLKLRKIIRIIVHINLLMLILSDECKAVALGAWKALDAVDAGRVDLKADRHGKICFIEANPLAGLNPVHSDLPILCTNVWN